MRSIVRLADIEDLFLCIYIWLIFYVDVSKMGADKLANNLKEKNIIK